MHYRNGREAQNGDKIVSLAGYGAARSTSTLSAFSSMRSRATTIATAASRQSSAAPLWVPACVIACTSMI